MVRVSETKIRDRKGISVCPPARLFPAALSSSSPWVCGSVEGAVPVPVLGLIRSCASTVPHVAVSCPCFTMRAVVAAHQCLLWSTGARICVYVCDSASNLSEGRVKISSAQRNELLKVYESFKIFLEMQGKNHMNMIRMHAQSTVIKTRLYPPLKQSS
jgi:hypothetical protein